MTQTHFPIRVVVFSVVDGCEDFCKTGFAETDVGALLPRGGSMAGYNEAERFHGDNKEDHVIEASRTISCICPPRRRIKWDIAIGSARQQGD